MVPMSYRHSKFYYFSLSPMVFASEAQAVSYQGNSHSESNYE